MKKGISAKAQKFAPKKTGKTQPNADGETPETAKGPLNIITADAGDPTIDGDAGTVKRMFQDGKEAFSAYKNLKRQNARRNNKNALIQKKLNLEPPYQPKKLESQGQNWRSNRPTGFMSTMIARVKPPYQETVDTSTTLTFAKMPGNDPKADSDTKIFRDRITETIRNWPGWADFISKIITENVTFGYTAAENINPFNWRPDALRQDEVFFPEDCSKDVDKIPVYGRARRYGIDELLPMFDDSELSGEAGWNVDNLVKAINRAMPPSRRRDGDNAARFMEDLIREGSYGTSYMEGAKYVEIAQVVAREPSGRCSLFLCDEVDGSPIFTRFDYFKNMSDALGVFSLEDGSGPLMTSRGAGRDLYNTHIAVERARNLIWDNLYLSSLILLVPNSEQNPQIAPLTVMHPVAIVSKGYEVVEKSGVPANTDAFFKLEAHAVAVASALVNVFLPGQIDPDSKDPKTATEASYLASIDAQIRQTILMRFLSQVVQVTTRMQRIICHPEHVVAAQGVFALLKPAPDSPLSVWAPQEVVEAFEAADIPLPAGMIAIPPTDSTKHLDEEAIRCVVAMLADGLDVSSILLMAHTPSVDLSPDTMAQYVQGIDAVAARYLNDPSINQQELKHRDIASKTSDTVADALVIPAEDNTIQIEQVREQKLEIAAMFQGNTMPVSPRDQDTIHLDVMDQDLTPVFSTMNGTLLPQMKPFLDAAVQHYSDHVQQAHAKGIPPEQLKKYDDALAATMKAMNEASAQLGSTPATAEPPTGGPAPAAVPSTPGQAPTQPPGPLETVTRAASPPAPPTPHPAGPRNSP